MTKADNKPRTKEKFTNRREYTFGLVGKVFHTLDEHGEVKHQGVVQAIVGDDKALVQYFEWMAGIPSELEIVFINDMVSQTDHKGLRWQFFEDLERMNFWYKHHYKSGPQKMPVQEKAE